MDMGMSTSAGVICTDWPDPKPHILPWGGSGARRTCWDERPHVRIMNHSNEASFCARPCAGTCIFSFLIARMTTRRLRDVKHVTRHHTALVNSRAGTETLLWPAP